MGLNKIPIKPNTQTPKFIFLFLIKAMYAVYIAVEHTIHRINL